MTQRANEGLLRAVDRMMLLFMAALAVVTALTQQQPARILFYLAAMALTMLASALAGPRWAPARVIRDFFPLPAVITIFNLAGRLVKFVADAKYHELLGVHIVGPHATDLIAEACIALTSEATVDEFVATIHAHPTVSEGIREAAEGVFGQAIHV